MMISTRGRYALRMMLDLARRGEEGYVSLKDIADRQNISPKYLEQIVPALNGAGLLRGVRGKRGGYRLSRAPADITAWEILLTAEGSLAPVTCLQPDQSDCPRRGDCDSLPVWKGLDRVVREYLSAVTLQDLIEQTDAGAEA